MPRKQRGPWREFAPQHNVPSPWNWVVAYPEGLSLGRFVDIGAFTYLQARRGISLGDFVEVGAHCAIYSESTIDMREGPVRVGARACIGSHSTVMPGVTIGEDAIVGAHSLVLRDVPPGVVAYGVPCAVRRALRPDELARRRAACSEPAPGEATG